MQASRSRTTPYLLGALFAFTLVCAGAGWLQTTHAQEAPSEAEGKAASDSDDAESDSPEQDAEEDSGEGVAEGAVREGAQELDPEDFGIGRVIADIAVNDLDGKPRRLTEDPDAKAIVVAMTNEACPMTRRFASTLKQLHADCEKLGISFFYLDATRSGKADELREMCEKRGFDASRYLHDPQGRLCASLGVRSTTDAFLIEAGTRKLLYHGAVNDQFGIGVNLPEPRNTWLRDAINAHLAGDPIEVSATHAPGCVLDFSKKDQADASLTWHGRISRIMQENCQSCHREGENAPFELTSYEDALDNTFMIKRVVQQRRMPPWFANPEHGEWKNEARLSDEDRQAIMDWVDADAPEGDPLDAPTPIQWPEGWNIGEPDHVITANEPFTVPAEGMIRYQYERVRTTLGQDKWVRGFEIRNTAPEAVHHVLVFIDYPRNHPRADESPNALGGLTGFFAGMVPGQTWIEYPKGLGKFLPKGSRLTFQIHYTAVGYEVENVTTLGMNFCDGKPAKELMTKGISNTTFVIPPETKDYEVKAHVKLVENVRLVTLMPHAHLRGVAFRYNIREPKKEAEILLDIPQYDFNWQLAYQFKHHRYLPKDSYLQVVGTYDNSKDNPANPDPKQRVRFGEQTWEEMMIGYVDYYVVEDEADMLPSERKALEAAGVDPNAGEEETPKDQADANPGEDSAAKNDDEASHDDAPKRGIDRLRRIKKRKEDSK